MPRLPFPKLTKPRRLPVSCRPKSSPRRPVCSKSPSSNQRSNSDRKWMTDISRSNRSPTSVRSSRSSSVCMSLSPKMTVSSSIPSTSPTSLRRPSGTCDTSEKHLSRDGGHVCRTSMRKLRKTGRRTASWPPTQTGSPSSSLTLLTSGGAQNCWAVRRIRIWFRPRTNG